MLKSTEWKKKTKKNDWFLMADKDIVYEGAFGNHSQTHVRRPGTSCPSLGLGAPYNYINLFHFSGIKSTIMHTN